MKVIYLANVFPESEFEYLFKVSNNKPQQQIQKYHRAYIDEFINEKEIFVHNEKVTIKPPKKYWIQRLFQRKHLILTVDIVDKNPYMLTEKARYIEVIK